MLTSKDYWQGYNDGSKFTREAAIEEFRKRIESLDNVKGIGPEIYKRIVQHINEGDFE